MGGVAEIEGEADEGEDEEVEEDDETVEEDKDETGAAPSALTTVGTELVAVIEDFVFVSVSVSVAAATIRILLVRGSIGTGMIVVEGND